MLFYIGDAFTDRIFGGNPAGIVIQERGNSFLSSEIMIKTAAELRYSETAFIQPADENTFIIRYFTPTEEVDLCGHATIASFKALMDAGLVKDDHTYMIDTLSGKLSVSIEGGSVMMDMAEPKIMKTISDPTELDNLAHVMGLEDRNSIHFRLGQAVNGISGIELLPQIVSTGLPDIIMPVSVKPELDQTINPDFAALAELSRHYGVTGVHAFTLDQSRYFFENEATCHCRNFGPAVGIDEEAATGTANGALTMYLYSRGMIRENEDNLFTQGENMYRLSKIKTNVTKSPEGNIKIRVGGNAVIVAKGEILI